MIIFRTEVENTVSEQEGGQCAHTEVFECVIVFLFRTMTNCVERSGGGYHKNVL